MSGIPSIIGSKEMVDDYISHEATREINRTMDAKLPSELASSVLTPGTAVLVFL